MKNFKQKIKKGLNYIAGKNNDGYSKGYYTNEAFEALNAIEQRKGKTDNRLVKLSDEYASEVLGNKKYAPWLYVYSAFTGEFKEGWIPNHYYGKVVCPKIKGDYGRLDNRKMLTNLLLEPKQSLDILYYVNQSFWNTDYKLCDERNIYKLLFDQNDKIVFKIENSNQGLGVYIINKQNFDIGKIKTLGNGVFQKFINQHDFFYQFSKKAVATIRFTSVINYIGEVEVRSTYLKGSIGEETHVKYSSEIVIPIDLNSGELYDYACNIDFSKIKRHPDSKVMFAKKQIPYFQDCMTEIKRMHSRIPYVKCIGWDVVVDKFNQFQLMEWNARHNSIKFSECFHGPCFTGLGWEDLHKS
jgi:hypothetical protein